MWLQVAGREEHRGAREMVAGGGVAVVLVVLSNSWLAGSQYAVVVLVEFYRGGVVCGASPTWGVTIFTIGSHKGLNETCQLETGGKKNRS